MGQLFVDLTTVRRLQTLKIYLIRNFILKVETMTTLCRIDTTERLETNLTFFDKRTKKESDEEFVTNIFQDLVLPRGPVFSVKVQTFHGDPDDPSSDLSLSSIRIDQCKAVQVKGPVSSVKVQNFNPNFGKLTFLEDS